MEYSIAHVARVTVVNRIDDSSTKLMRKFTEFVRKRKIHVYEWPTASVERSVLYIDKADVDKVTKWLGKHSMPKTLKRHPKKK